MSDHTKRSYEFLKRIERLLTKLATDEPIDSHTRRELAEILAANTTDNTCMVKAKDDEPVFVLIGHDQLFCDTVSFWMHRSKLADLHEDKLADAADCVVEGEQYQRKIP